MTSREHRLIARNGNVTVRTTKPSPRYNTTLSHHNASRQPIPARPRLPQDRSFKTCAIVDKLDKIASCIQPTNTQILFPRDHLVAISATERRVEIEQYHRRGKLKKIRHHASIFFLVQQQ
ncbi:hypothetical protein E8E11_005036 [Didymella keratinophila]|nr:hypothetical protein E8E11_005036 [Didymella keratinophila]